MSEDNHDTKAGLENSRDKRTVKFTSEGHRKAFGEMVDRQKATPQSEQPLGGRLGHPAPNPHVQPWSCPSCGVSGRWWETEEPWRCSLCGEDWTELRDFERSCCPWPDCDGSYADPWFDRVAPGAYVCSKCGRDADATPEEVDRETRLAAAVKKKTAALEKLLDLCEHASLRLAAGYEIEGFRIAWAWREYDAACAKVDSLARD